MIFDTLERAQGLIEEGRFNRALQLLRAAPPRLAKPEHAYLKAEALRGCGYFHKAASFYEEALRCLDGASDALWLDSVLGLVRALRSLGLTKQARGWLSRGEEKRRNGYVLELKLELALLDRAEGKYSRSLSRLSDVLAVYRKNSDWAGVGFVLWAMAGARRFAGNLKGAEMDFLTSLSAFKRAHDPEGMGYAWLGLGGIRRIRGNPAQSHAAYARALEAFAGGEDLFALAYGHCGLANALRRLGKLSEAQAHYRQSGRLYKKLGDAVDGAYVDWGLGKIALELGRLKRAAGLLRRALAAFSRYGETRGIALSELALASILHAQGLSAKAEALFARAFQRARKAKIHAHLEFFT